MDVDAALTHLANEATAPLDLAELALSLARDAYPSLDRYLLYDLRFRGNQLDDYEGSREVPFDPLLSEAGS
jgi:hypothetical protein